MVLSNAGPEAALPTSFDLWFETARTHKNDDIPILAWEVALNVESQSCSGEVAAAANEDKPVEQEICHTENTHEEN